MSTSSQILIGLGIAGVIGAAGAAGARHLASRVQLPAKQSFSGVRHTASLKLVNAEAEVRAFAPDGNVRIVRVDDVLPRPTGIMTSDLEGFATLEMGNVRVIASREAHVMFNAPGTTIKVYVNHGRVLVNRATGIDVIVPDENLTVTGTSFGVWAQDGRTLIAVIDGEVTVKIRGVKNTYAKGREVIVTDDGSTFAVIPDKLLLYIDEAEDLGGRFQVTGKTSPFAQLMVRRGDFYESVEIQPSGVFVTELARNEPATRELIAFDTAGRRAEVARPSEDLAAVREALGVLPEKHPSESGNQVKNIIQVDPASEEAAAAEAEPSTGSETPEEEIAPVAPAAEDTPASPVETESEAAPEPPAEETSTPEAAPASKAAVKAAPALEAAPAPAPKAAPAPALKAAPEAAPAPTPKAAPAPSPKVAPVPAPPPKVAPAPAAKPAPKAAPKVAPKPAPKKKAAPKPAPKKKAAPKKNVDLSDDDLELEWD